jgi:hypothetical protein
VVGRRTGRAGTLIEHRDHPDAPAAALRLLDASEDSLARCPRSEWREWAAVCEAVEETLRRIEDTQRRRLGPRRVEARGEARLLLDVDHRLTALATWNDRTVVAEGEVAIARPRRPARRRRGRPTAAKRSAARNGPIPG